MPLLSVIIPLYNHDKYIEETISSVLVQTFADFELLIIDDGSIDRSASVVRKFSDSRIKYFYQANRGAHNAINRGIDLAEGKYISILNSDDVYTQQRFEKCILVLEENPSIDAVFSGIEYIDENSTYLNTIIGAEENWLHHQPETSFKSEKNLTLDLLAGNFLKTTSNLFCRSDCFQTIGLFRNLRYAHDYDFFLKLSYQCHVKIIDEPLLKYRCHTGNTLKESRAAADFECALVISDFLITHDLDRVFDTQDPAAIIKFFNSINTHHSDRIILTLLLFSHLSRSDETIFNMLVENSAHPFWKTGHDYLANYHDGWQARERIFNDWNKLHSSYLRSEEERLLAINSKGYRVENFLKTKLLKLKKIVSSLKK